MSENWFSSSGKNSLKVFQTWGKPVLPEHQKTSTRNSKIIEEKSGEIGCFYNFVPFVFKSEVIHNHVHRQIRQIFKFFAAGSLVFMQNAGFLFSG